MVFKPFTQVIVILVSRYNNIIFMNKLYIYIYNIINDKYLVLINYYLSFYYSNTIFVIFITLNQENII
jgi:hypothetical protein